MSLSGALFRDRAPRMERRDASYSLRQLAIDMAAQVSTGPSVSSVDQAIRDAATWACVSIKTKGIAMLPVDVVRYEGKRRISVPAPQVVASPSALVPRRVWVSQLGWSMFTDGNVFGLVRDVDAMARPSQIELVNPDQARERKVVDGVPQVKIGTEVHQRFPYGDLWHIPGEHVPAGSPFGLSPIAYGSRTTGTALAAELFGGQFFSDGGHPTWLFLGPEHDPGEVAATTLKLRIKKLFAGNREPVIIPKSLEPKQIQINPEDSQFIDLMRFEVEQTCRRHGVPPSMVYGAVSGQNVTYANVAQADLHYLRWTLSHPIDLIEDAWSALLPAPRVVKFNRDAILEGDPSAKVEMHAKRLGSRIATVNEVRALDDLDPFGPEFDVPGIPPIAAPSADLPKEGAA